MDFLASTYFFDYESAAVQNLIAEFRDESLSALEKAKGLYVKVRDGWRYNPYHINLDESGFRASVLIDREDGHCIEKAIILIAGLRALGIPARLRLAKVTNHIAVERLTEKFGSNVLTPHGMVDVFLNGKWVKATPAFNKELCEKCRVAPLEFDGESDSVFQSYNNDGSRFMEYIADYGYFDDVPIGFMKKNLQDNYPDVFDFENGIVAYKF